MTTPKLPSAVSPPTDAGPFPDVLSRLDDTLMMIRRMHQRPWYRRQVLGELDGSVGMATVRLLRVVERFEEPPTIGAAAEVLVIDPSTASRLVERAVHSGLLERQPCPDDRRRALLVVTEAGRSLLAAVTARRLALLAGVTDGWSEHEVDELIRRMQRLLDGLDLLEVQA